MKRVLISTLIILCCVCLLDGCHYFTEASSHDQDFAEKVSKAAMFEKYRRGTSQYESVSFGQLMRIKDSVVNLNGSKINLKHRTWKEIENNYVLKRDGQITDRKTDWILVDSTETEAICCLIKNTGK